RCQVGRLFCLHLSWASDRQRFHFETCGTQGFVLHVWQEAPRKPPEKRAVQGREEEGIGAPDHKAFVVQVMTAGVDRIGRMKLYFLVNDLRPFKRLEVSDIILDLPPMVRARLSSLPIIAAPICWLRFQFPSELLKVSAHRWVAGDVGPPPRED